PAPNASAVSSRREPTATTVPLSVLARSAANERAIPPVPMIPHLSKPELLERVSAVDHHRLARYVRRARGREERDQLRDLRRGSRTLRRRVAARLQLLLGR